MFNRCPTSRNRTLSAENHSVSATVNTTSVTNARG